jgi:hypothetical protein
MWIIKSLSSNQVGLTIELSAGWGEGIESPFQISIWCNLVHNGDYIIEFMDTIDN